MPFYKCYQIVIKRPLKFSQIRCLCGVQKNFNYSHSTTNIASHIVANKSGYVPIWVDTFGTILDGSSVYSDIVNVLSL